MMAVRFSFLLVLLTAFSMRGEGHMLQETGQELSLPEGQVRTKRFIFNRHVNVKYFLHTRETGGTPEDLADNIPDLSGTTFRSNRPTKFIIHGFLSAADKPWVVDMANALLEAEDLNVFAVDWREGASPGLTGKNYLQAKRNCRRVGQTVGEFVPQLGQPQNMVHIIGHSLGAHAAGFAGKATQRTGFTVARISGLDPAGPGFRRARAADRLDRGDAMFVDVIHTDILVLGKLKPIGHVDFYPNEGWLQPGCKLRPGCSHGRAPEFYTESISSGCQFPAYRCPDWETFFRNRGQCDVCSHSSLTNGACSLMGYPSINFPNSEGSMYLKTSMNPSSHCRSRGRRDTVSNKTSTDQCVQSLDSDMRQEIRDYLDSATDLQEMEMDGDYLCAKKNMAVYFLTISQTWRSTQYVSFKLFLLFLLSRNEFTKFRY
ncbi:pancreatic triacylglycerol lipase-like [Branchiostoma floridae x Branchiostoma japonicum]